MFGSESFCFSFWWLIPILMIGLCIFMLRGRRGGMMCGFGSGDSDDYLRGRNGAALGILAERFARGDIDEMEYKTRKATLTGTKED